MGITKNIIKKNNYKDSVFLMQIAADLESINGINAISLMMGTPANKEILDEAGLLNNEGKTSTQNDLIIAITAINDETIKKALAKIEQAFNATVKEEIDAYVLPKTISEAKRLFQDINFSLISIPGQYAAREAKKSLDNGLNVMIFSDNVSIEEEIALKQKALDLDLLLMGPDCGSAIINGIPLGFANQVPRGEIGITAASGTGFQEVSVLIAKHGKGISQGFGTGGRDLKKEIGGTTMLQSLEFLKNDPDTKVIVLISKPPDKEIAEKIINSALQSQKNTVICFLGSAEYKDNKNLFFCKTLEDTALKALQFIGDDSTISKETQNYENIMRELASKLNTGTKYIRGLYTGGTLCDEALDILKDNMINANSNVYDEGEFKLKDPNSSFHHSLIDLGEDEFTVGRPHPMIDHTLRNKRIIKEADDPETAVILFDLVLGYGAHPDPATAMKEALQYAANKKILIASICGLDSDPQNYSKQAKILNECGVTIMPSNAQAVKLAAKVLNS